MRGYRLDGSAKHLNTIRFRVEGSAATSLADPRRPFLSHLRLTCAILGDKDPEAVSFNAAQRQTVVGCGHLGLGAAGLRHRDPEPTKSGADRAAEPAPR
ncbi:hypothetical protein THIOKS1580011 [Thiocapsa sp. KS1]|nr:hypothetical protein THIOKS1580011 [Thiocapsa sp. KS1]